MATNYDGSQNWQELLIGTWQSGKEKGDSGMTDNQGQPSFFKSTTFYLLLALLAGIVFLGFSVWAHIDEWLKELALGLSVASITASILGFAVDRVMAKELATEAVKFMLGYRFPEGLGDEVRRIYAINFFVCEHISEYNINLNPDGEMVTMHLKMIRKYQNFTKVKQNFQIAHSADQFRDTSTVIEGLSYWLKDSDKSVVLKDIEKKSKIVEGAVEYTGDKISIDPDSWIELTTIHRETKLKDGVFFMVLPTPTFEPKITVNIGQGLEYRKGYTHRNGKLNGDKLLGTL